MAKLNKKATSNLTTHEGAKVPIINAELQLRRSVMACLLWENTFYEDGQSIADRIKTLVHFNKAEVVAQIAIEAREQMKLRHVPLLLVRELARHKNKSLTAKTLERVIQRADELTEFLAIYWKDGKETISAQVKRGLAKAFTKFSAYDLAKYNRQEAIKLRDVLFLVHAKPKDDEQAAIWKKLVDGTLESPDTWEVELSASKDKKASWQRLLSEKKLGPLALIRNIRNMTEAGLSNTAISTAIRDMMVERVLPFRFITAARHNPQFEPVLESSMMKCLESKEKIGGKTILLIDVSGSMDSNISGKSEVLRIDAACGVAILARELYEDVRVVTFSEKLVEVPARRGFALRDAIKNSQEHSGTYLGRAVDTINQKFEYDRIIVFTDEQSHDSLSAPKSKGYVVNVSCDKNGIGYGAWNHIDGFSESVIDFIKISDQAPLTPPTNHQGRGEGREQGYRMF